VLRPLKRRDDGTFGEIPLEAALDEIAHRIRTIVDRDGAEAIGGYRGSGAGLNAAACFLLDSVLHPLGSRKVFSAATIDQSAKFVAAERLGMWPPGTHPVETSDVILMFGLNPLVSLSPAIDPHNIMKRLKQQLERGLKLLMVDPRRTETVRFAHLHLQPLPGEDAAIAAGMIRLILDRGLEDKDFLARHGSQLAELRQAVEPFTVDYVARRADVPAEGLVELTEVFAAAKRGHAITGTGGNMGPHSNLVEHLVQCLNVVCGRFAREGEKIGNPGALSARSPRPCQVVPASRPWEKSYRSRIAGYGLIYGELPTGIMADEILEPGPGRIKAFICHGGNAGVIVPDQAKVVRAFRSLELLVTVDPFMTTTAQLSHYVLPTVMQYERPDLPCWQAETIFNRQPFTRYTPAVARPPAGSEVAADDYIFWSLAKRLGLQMMSLGVPIDMSRPPATDDFLAIAARHAPVSFETLRSCELGAVLEGEPQYAVAGDPGPHDRFTLCPDDVVEEMRALARENFRERIVVGNGSVATHRFTVRRHRDVFNSIGRELTGVKRRLPYNTAAVNPADLAVLGLASGDKVRIASEAGAVDAIVEADETLRPGVLSMLHGFGGVPESSEYLRDGASVNLLISTDWALEPINAMPRMTAFAVAIESVNPPDHKST
jgi:anaerobic selenocysteine-containing dehydrogenase